MSKPGKVPIDQAWINWRECLSGEDPNSIYRQIYQMVWDSAIFHLILQSRQIFLEQFPDDPQINPYLHSFLDRSVVQSQVATIRRLADRSKYGLRGDKGIYSLYALIEDLKIYRVDLTRENFFKLRKLPYNYADIIIRREKFLQEQAQKGLTAFFVPPELDWESIEQVHQDFDRLSGVRSEDRNPGDVIRESVFYHLEEKLDTCFVIIEYVNKYVAHSATPESRLVGNPDSEPTLKQIWESHQVLCEVAEFLSGFFYSEGHVLLAWEPPNLFKYWDTPIVQKENIDSLKSSFDRYRTEIDQWRSNGVEKLWQWIESH